LARRRVEATSTHVALSPFVLLDTHELAASADRVLDEHAVRWDDVGYLSRAGNELLPDWYQDWVVEQRDQLRERRADDSGTAQPTWRLENLLRELG